MRFDVLIQFIVPLTFLAIWALTSILNRDAQPLPPRPGRPGGGPGARRPPGAGGNPTDPLFRPAERLAERPGPAPTGRERTGGLPSPRRTARPNSLEEAIVFLDSETAKQGQQGRSAPPIRGTGAGLSGTRGQRGTVPRRTRNRTPDPPAPRQSGADAEPRRVLSDQVGQAMDQKRSKPLEITPLSTPLTSLSAPLTQPLSSSATPSTLTSGSDPVLALNEAEIRRMLASPRRVREAFLLSEILGQPVALRRRRTM